MSSWKARSTAPLSTSARSDEKTSIWTPSVSRSVLISAIKVAMAKARISGSQSASGLPIQRAPSRLAIAAPTSLRYSPG